MFGGGGVGILGQGTSGARGASTQCASLGGGRGGSGGANAASGGGAYGGGGGYICVGNAYPGGVGAVRIVWPGNTRSFPSTCVGAP
jgi:hypothetical protein